MTKLHKTIIVFISIIMAAFCVFVLPFVLFGENGGGMIILSVFVGGLVFVVYLTADAIVEAYWR
jgi:hypothetical protein